MKKIAPFLVILAGCCWATLGVFVRHLNSIGLESMQMICKRYGGTMELQWDDTTFTVLFILPAKAENEAEPEAAAATAE